jgi:outer membrane protein TolC
MGLYCTRQSALLASIFRFMRNKARVGMTGLFCLLVAHNASGQQLSFEQHMAKLLALLADHPSIGLSRQNELVQTLNADAAMGLPNPSFTLGFNNLPVDDPTAFDRFLPSNMSLEFRQTLPSSDTRNATKSTGMARAEQTRWERKVMLAQLEKRLIIALAERQRITEATSILQQKMGLLAEMQDWLEGSMQGGESQYSRLIEIEAQRGQINERTVALRGEDLRWQAELRALVGHVPSIELPNKISPRLWNEDPATLLPVQVALSRVNVAQSEVTVKESDFGWDYAVGFAYQVREESDRFDGDDWFTLKLTASVPLWSDSNQKPKLAAAHAAVTAATAYRDQQLREARLEYDNAMAALDTSRSLVEALLEREKSLLYLQTSNRRRYEAGEIGLEPVIKAALQQADLRLTLSKQRAQLAKATASINALLIEEES